MCVCVWGGLLRWLSKRLNQTQIDSYCGKSHLNGPLSSLLNKLNKEGKGSDVASKKNK